MLPSYHTYVAETDGVVCYRCKAPIPKGQEFAVTSTPSEPNKINCLGCTDDRLAQGERHLKIDGREGKVKSGTQRKD